MKLDEIPLNANPLDMDLSGLDLRREVLAGNVPYELLIKECRLDPVKNHQGDELIYVEMTNNGPATSPTGQAIAPHQVTVFDRINLKAYGKANPALVIRRVAEFQQALGINGALRPALPGLKGRTVRATLKVSPAGTNAATGKSYPEKNEVSYYHKQGS